MIKKINVNGVVLYPTREQYPGVCDGCALVAPVFDVAKRGCAYRVELACVERKIIWLPTNLRRLYKVQKVVNKLEGTKT